MGVKQVLESLFQKKLRLFLVIGVFLGVVSYFYEKNFPGLDSGGGQIILTGHRRLTREEILKAMNVDQKMRVDNLDLPKLEEGLKRLRRVKDATVIKRSRDQILVTVQEKRPVYVVSSNDSLYEVDSDYNLVSIDDVRETGLCVISGDFKLENGQFKGTEFKDLANSLSQAFRMYPDLKDRISEVNLRKGGLMVYIFAPKRFKVWMGRSLDTTQVRKLYAALAYFESQNLEIKTLDLRGDDAVFQ
jgi:hypothetical protein